METFSIAPELAHAAEELSHAHRGGIVRVLGATFTSKREVPEVADLTGIFGASLRKLKARELAELNEMSPEDIGPEHAEHAEVALAELRASAEKSATGTHTDPRSTMRERFGVRLGSGPRPVWGHFKTVKVGKETQIVLNEEGLPTVESIKLDVLELGRIVREEGVRKTVNSRAKTLAKNAFSKRLSKMVKSFRSITLKVGSFETVKHSGTETKVEGINIQDWSELVQMEEVV